MTRRVYPYAFDRLFKIVDCKFLEGEAITVQNMLRLADWMTDRNAVHFRVYAVDNPPGLYTDFRETIQTNDFAKHLEFADMVSREGILLK